MDAISLHLVTGNAELDEMRPGSFDVCNSVTKEHLI